MSRQVGRFRIDVWQGGWPIWVVLEDDRGARMQFSADDLRDLEYAVQSAKREVEEQEKQRRGSSHE